MKSYNKVKLFLDYLFSVLLTVCLSPLLAVLALAIKIDSKGPVFFLQKRIGKDSKEFYIYKFRTMKTDAPKDMPTHLFTDPQAFITPLGRFLRKSSLDELPQLFNILKGEMSFIGPRPALWNQYDLIFLRKESGVDQLRPGITGWAQVNGRDALPIAQKAKLDEHYFLHLRFGLDFKILCMTFTGVISAKDVR